VFEDLERVVNEAAISLRESQMQMKIFILNFWGQSIFHLTLNDWLTFFIDLLLFVSLMNLGILSS
jgi:hypothetical protein